jgi:hypothetical protein
MPPDFTCLILLEIYSTNPISLSKRKGQRLLHKYAWQEHVQPEIVQIGIELD